MRKMNTLASASVGLALATVVSVCGSPLQDPGSRDRRPPRPQENQPAIGPLTKEQLKVVTTILSGYNAATLTADQARSIHESFRQAGLRAGPEMADAIRAAGFDPDRLRDLAPQPDPNNRRGPRQLQEQGRYSIEQAISDQAQLNTIAFDGLAFLTGNMGGNTFLPPGKVADYCGFQYMRDVDVNHLGHNTSFVPRAANAVLHILTDQQKAQLMALAAEQEKLLVAFAYKRFPLIQAFSRQLQADIPAGSAGLDREAITKYTAELFEIDGRLSYQRAEVLGRIIRSLTDAQRAYLAKMAFNDSASWPQLPDQVDKRSLSPTRHVAVMTYASEMFSWYAGNVEADTYFCPERHATYFGSFYLKDIPAMGNADHSISASLTGDSGQAFLSALTPTQRQLITNLVDQQRTQLVEIVKTRRAISTELRRFLKEPSADKNRILATSKRYGELDGQISYSYAVAFTQVARTLTAEQKKMLLRLRNLDARYACKGAYVYSEPIDMPPVPNTDFLFRRVDPANHIHTDGTSDLR